MNAFDIIVAVVIVLSGLFAFARGFVKELLSIASWLGATFAALYGLPYIRPFVERFIHRGPIADAAGAIVIFIVALIVLSMITSGMARRVRTSSLSALDRTFGLIFGLLRGVLLVCVGFLVLNWLLPPGSVQPRWLIESRTAPLLAGGAAWLEHFVPPRFRGEEPATPISDPERTVEQAIRAYRSPTPPPEAKDAPPSYTPNERAGLNRLFQQEDGKK